MTHSLPLHSDIFDILDVMQQCQTPQEVGTLLAGALVAFGLKHYAIGGMPIQGDPNPTSFMFHNFPEGWPEQYFDHDYGTVDPVPRAAMICAMPMTMGELRAGKAGFLPGPETDTFFAELDRVAGSKGLVVPIAGPHGYHGIAAFVGATEDFTPADRARLHMLAIYAHDRMLALFGKAPLGKTADTAPRPLSQREVEVMRLARIGAGDAAIAVHLGISVRTVRFHFENIRKRLAVKTRSEALVKAVGLHLLGS